MVRALRFYLFVACAALTGCGGGGGGLPKRINPPVASVQQLRALPDGRWELDLRLQNFSTVPMTFGTIEADLRIGETSAGPIFLQTDIEIAGQYADVVSTTLSPSAAAREAMAGAKGGEIPYRLVGSISASKPDKRFPFDHASRLAPVPGVPNTYR
ncbi:MAG: hypothetical protein ABI411_04780 [Tahibacter sp.]